MCTDVPSRRSLFVLRVAWCMALLLVGFQRTVAERLPLKPYTTADGLAHNEVNKIVRDSRGFLWFCTSEGLSRFDGYSFTNYGVEQGLPHRTVNAFLETRSGDIWVATNAGLVRFDPKGAPTTVSFMRTRRRSKERRRCPRSSSPKTRTGMPDSSQCCSKAVTAQSGAGR